MIHEPRVHLLTNLKLSGADNAYKHRFNSQTIVARMRGDDACAPPCYPRAHSHSLPLTLESVEALAKLLRERIAAQTPHVTLVPGRNKVSLADAEHLLSKVSEFLAIWRKSFIQTIRLKSILSYGPDAAELALEPLNVLIGPNASGKSNLIEALSLLAAAPRDLQEPIREGGGVREWLWKGGFESTPATIDVTVPSLQLPVALRYRLSFTETGWRFELRDEAVETEIPLRPNEEQPYIYYRYQDGHPVINVMGETAFKRDLQREDVNPDQSILSQRRDPDLYPELTYLSDIFGRMSFYRESNLGRRTPLRGPQKSDLPQDRLLEDASNLGLVLSDLMNRPVAKERILERMRDFYPSFRDVNATVIGGAVQIFFHEDGLRQPVPATRLSDGSLRYLSLLAVLCHPDPPPITCIEEPELGLHPDAIPEVAKLLVEASTRSQIFVTTHSDVLVDALTDIPESIIICEKVDGATQLRRLDANELKPWLEQYRLGELWTRGRFGGNRW